MTRHHRRPLTAAALAAALTLAAAPGAHAEITGPYTVDADTLQLWHFDEGGGATAFNAVGGGVDVTVGTGGAGFLPATLGNPGFFGNALDTNPSSRALAFSNEVPTSAVAGPGGAFTHEALINLDWNFQGNGNSFPRVQQIITLDDESDGAGSRVSQFRIETDGRLTFINIGGATQAVSTAGNVATFNDPVAADEWYHVAVAYNGDAGAANNLEFYWTRLDPDTTRAQLVHTATLNADLQGANGDLSIGNEARDESTDGLIGQIDEARISGVARDGAGFVFGKAKNAYTLLSDGFDVPDNDDISAGVATRQTGVLAGTTYTEIGGGSASSIAVNDGQALLSTDTGNRAVKLDTDLAAGAAGAHIAAANFFAIDLDFNARTTTVGEADDWFSLSLGNNAASGDGQNVTNGEADFGVLFRDNGQFQLFDNGANVTPGANVYDVTPNLTEWYNLRIEVRTDDFNLGTAALLSLFINGRQIDLTNGAGLDYAFTWDADGQNYLILESWTTVSRFDNLVISSLPTPGALPAGLALLGALATRRSARLTASRRWRT